MLIPHCLFIFRVEILSKFAALALLLSLSLKIGFFAMAIICFNRIWIYHFSAEYRSLFAYAKTVATCLIDCVQVFSSLETIF